MGTSRIALEMPLLARHVGEWDGTYVWVDEGGAVVDRHRAQLTCAFPDDGPYDYLQVNRYTWDDGRAERIEFPATYRDGRLHFDTDRISGSAWEVDDRTICLTWTRKDDPGGFFYEMIQLDDAGENRARVWQWFEGGVCRRRTLIDERRIG